MCCIVEHGTCVSGFWPCAYWWLLLQTRFAQTVQRSHRWHSQNSGSLAGVPATAHEICYWIIVIFKYCYRKYSKYYISRIYKQYYLIYYHFLHDRRRLDRGACVSTWTVRLLPAPPKDWSILIIWSLWCREVFLLWMLLSVDEAENIWFWVAWENL